MINTVGLILMLAFMALFGRLRSITTLVESQPRAEGWDEEDESSADDPIRFRVDSEDWMPVDVRRN